jgi:hypothetical protein
MSKVGDIVIEKAAEAVRVFLRPADGGPDVLLAAMHSVVYERHAPIKEEFEHLAAAIAVNLDRAAGEMVAVQSMPPVQPAEAKLDRQHFPCWNCLDPQAAEARAHLLGFSDADLAASLSPRGTPVFCCKVTAAGSLTV